MRMYFRLQYLSKQFKKTRKIIQVVPKAFFVSACGVLTQGIIHVVFLRQQFRSVTIDLTTNYSNTRFYIPPDTLPISSLPYFKD